MSLKKHIDRFIALLLHYSIFRGKAGTIDFYGMNEPDIPDNDGIVILRDRRATPEMTDDIPVKPTTTSHLRAYRFHLENRYLLTKSVATRMRAVWQYCHDIDGVEFIAVLENNHTYTPFGQFDRIPSRFLEVVERDKAVPFLDDPHDAFEAIPA